MSATFRFWPFLESTLLRHDPASPARATWPTQSYPHYITLRASPNQQKDKDNANGNDNDNDNDNDKYI